MAKTKTTAPAKATFTPHLATVSKREHDHRTDGYQGMQPHRIRIYTQSEGKVMPEDCRDRIAGYRSLLPAIYREAGIPEGTKATWSQKAGCACGCSPGFITEHVGTYTVYVDVTWTEEESAERELHNAAQHLMHASLNGNEQADEALGHIQNALQLLGLAPLNPDAEKAEGLAHAILPWNRDRFAAVLAAGKKEPEPKPEPKAAPVAVPGPRLPSDPMGFHGTLPSGEAM